MLRLQLTGENAFNTDKDHLTTTKDLPDAKIATYIKCKSNMEFHGIHFTDFAYQTMY